ncbi:MAG: MoxR family ATPase [Chloroflexaceae bacterium]|jgi:hypothetical protein|nr:MoxR family ATPase [Chloroflexaceae bacterium]
MKPGQLSLFLDGLIRHQLKLSTMIWGPPGIGKSSIVAQTATAHGLAFVDLRLSQLAPTDLRGLPVAVEGVSRWFPPEFLPHEGAGVLFLDEINLAPPAMQGMAQQLILDRRVGSYVLPDGWFIWAAGNRKEDRAAVFDMPAPLANRFIHLEVEVDFESFKSYALAQGFVEQVLAFLAFRPELLHKLDAKQVAWPSPRSWEMASQLHRAGMDVAAAVGASTAQEFYAYLELYRDLPDLAQILHGNGDGLPFPGEPSVRFAAVVGLTARASDASRVYHAFRWIIASAPAEWAQLFAVDMLKVVRSRGMLADLRALLDADGELKARIDALTR